MTFSISKRSFWISNLVLLLVSVLYYSSCKQATDESYSFFVAGHTYGSPAGDNIGLHPPFLDEFDKLNNDTRLAFGIFTGDIVRKASQVAWDTIDRQLERLDMKVYFCAGNHDTYQRELYEGRYGNTFYSFKHNKDLFIILDGSLNRWNIEGKQLEFLHNTLVEAAPSVNNVFVFIHQLVWWDENNVFSSVKLNWPPYTPDTTNYWSTVEPLLQAYRSPVYIFAGDVGASHQASPVIYYPDRNVTYIASGMGSIEADNYIIVTVEGKAELSYELVSPGDDPAKMGKLEDYLLSATP